VPGAWRPTPADWANNHQFTVSAVLLAVELLLFEFRPRSLVRVALASCSAAGARIFFDGAAPIFSMPALEHPAGTALWFRAAAYSMRSSDAG
jgi:hypothetical protein